MGCQDLSTHCGGPSWAGCSQGSLPRVSTTIASLACLCGGSRLLKRFVRGLLGVLGCGCPPLLSQTACGLILLEH